MLTIGQLLSLIAIEIEEIQKPADEARNRESVGLWLSEKIPNGALQIWWWADGIVGRDEDGRKGWQGFLLLGLKTGKVVDVIVDRLRLHLLPNWLLGLKLRSLLLLLLLLSGLEVGLRLLRLLELAVLEGGLLGLEVCEWWGWLELGLLLLAKFRL